MHHTHQTDIVHAFIPVHPKVLAHYVGDRNRKRRGRLIRLRQGLRTARGARARRVALQEAAQEACVELGRVTVINGNFFGL
jgi:hypothetical protein